jgi:diguanylate cyclase (GGDEF)-like protein
MSPVSEPTTPPEEEQRLAALRDLRLLDTPPEERFDRITRLAARLFDVPIVLIGLMDGGREWFKSRLGWTAPEVPRESSFSSHTILGDETLVIPDTLKDPRFSRSPLVTGGPSIRFYAGCSISDAMGYRVGTLSILDRRPRRAEEVDVGALKDLAGMARDELCHYTLNRMGVLLREKEEQFRRAQEAILNLSLTDELTGLYNRRGFLHLAEQHRKLASRVKKEFLILFADLDHMKEINDTYGHAEGDRALVKTAQLLRRTFRESDVLGRLGGDEFTILAIDAPLNFSTTTASRLDAALQQYNTEGAAPYELSLSVGVVGFDPNRDTTIEDLITQADREMYQQKQNKRRPP